MDNIDRLYEISRILVHAPRFEDDGIYLSFADVRAINRHLGKLYEALMEGDLEGDEGDDWDDDAED